MEMLIKPVVRGVAARGNFLGWNPNLTDGTLTLLQMAQGHFSFFISICSKVRVFLFWKVDT
jgi:hypothetical protein